MKMEEQDEIKLSELQYSNGELVTGIDCSHSSDTETLQDEVKANNVDRLDENANRSVEKELKTQDIRKNPLLDNEDQKDENENVSSTLDIKPSIVGRKNISIGTIRDKIKKQLELKKSAKDNETREELMKESITNEEFQKVKGIEEDQKGNLVNFDNEIVEIKNNKDQGNTGSKKDEQDPLLELVPEKIDKELRDESTLRLMTNKEVKSFLLSHPPKKLVTAEELVAISKAASQDKWIVYNSEDGELAEWLSNIKPSAIKRSDGVGWIAAKTDQSIWERKKACQEELKAAWESVVANTDQINTNTVMGLAKQFGVTGGKWIFHVTTDRVDVVWGRVAMALHKGKLGKNVTQAKVSPVFDTSEGEATGMGAHVISVYNRDFTDQEKVLQVETSLRQAKIRCMFQYKPEVYSILGIYRNNRWGLRPTIYHSQYHLKRGESIIESALENTWFRNETKGFGDDNKEMKDKRGSKDEGHADPKKTNTTIKKAYNVIEDDRKDDYEKQKDECTIEDPGLKLLKGLGIDLGTPEIRIPLEMKYTPTDGLEMTDTTPDGLEMKDTAPDGLEMKDTTPDGLEMKDTTDERELEVEIKDARNEQDVEELRSKVMSWLLADTGHTEDTSCVSEITRHESKIGAFYSTSADANDGATQKKDIHGQTEKLSDHDNSPMEKVLVANITPANDVIDELVSMKVTNDADDKSTPVENDKKEKADLKKPSWLRNLQNKVKKES